MFKVQRELTSIIILAFCIYALRFFLPLLFVQIPLTLPEEYPIISVVISTVIIDFGQVIGSFLAGFLFGPRFFSGKAKFPAIATVVCASFFHLISMSPFLFRTSSLTITWIPEIIIITLSIFALLIGKNIRERKRE